MAAKVQNVIMETRYQALSQEKQFIATSWRVSITTKEAGSSSRVHSYSEFPISMKNSTIVHEDVHTFAALLNEVAFICLQLESVVNCFPRSCNTETFYEFQNLDMLGS
jgi:hypothetical protein